MNSLEKFVSSIGPLIAEKSLSGKEKSFLQTGIAQSTTTLVANLKSMVSNRFLSVLGMWISDRLDFSTRVHNNLFPPIDKELSGKIGNIIARFVLGSSGDERSEEEDVDNDDSKSDDEDKSDGDEDDVDGEDERGRAYDNMSTSATTKGEIPTHDECDQNLASTKTVEDSIKTFRRSIEATRSRISRLLNTTENSLIESLMKCDEISALRHRFLPAYLLPLVDEWKTGLAADHHANFPLVFRLFEDVNRVEFRQHLFIQPNAKARAAPLTTTTLASLTVLFLHTKTDIQLHEHLADRVSSVIELVYDTEKARTKARSDFFKKDRLSLRLPNWTPHPEVVWQLVFPGIQVFLEARAKLQQRLAFLHAGTTDGNVINCLFAKLHTMTSKASPTGNTVLFLIDHFNEQSFRLQDIVHAIGGPNFPSMTRTLKLTLGLWQASAKRIACNLDQQATVDLRGCLDWTVPSHPARQKSVCMPHVVYSMTDL